MDICPRCCSHHRPGLWLHRYASLPQHRGNSCRSPPCIVYPILPCPRGDRGYQESDGRPIPCRPRDSPIQRVLEEPAGLSIRRREPGHGRVRSTHVSQPAWEGSEASQVGRGPALRTLRGKRYCRSEFRKDTFGICYCSYGLDFSLHAFKTL